jgi:Spy/CpxP family protein refolding chaperone
VASNRLSTKIAAAIAILVVFVAGLVIGIAGDRAWLVLHGRLSMRHGASDTMVKMLVNRLNRELNLTPAQRTAVTAILRQSRDRIAAIDANVRPQVRAQMAATSAEIENVLTPEQRTKFVEIRKKMEARHRGSPFYGPSPPR